MENVIRTPEEIEQINKLVEGIKVVNEVDDVEGTKPSEKLSNTDLLAFNLKQYIEEIAQRDELLTTEIAALEHLIEVIELDLNKNIGTTDQESSSVFYNDDIVKSMLENKDRQKKILCDMKVTKKIFQHRISIFNKTRDWMLENIEMLENVDMLLNGVLKLEKTNETIASFVE